MSAQRRRRLSVEEGAAATDEGSPSKQRPRSFFAPTITRKRSAIFPLVLVGLLITIYCAASNVSLRKYFALQGVMLSVEATTVHSEAQQYRPLPLMVQFDFETNAVRPLRSFVNTTKEATSREGLLRDPSKYEEEKDEVCQPMHEWQTQSYVKCNLMHELDAFGTLAVDGKLKFRACGDVRCAFEIEDFDGTPLALKVRKFGGKFTPRYLKGSWKDGMAMERLSKSPYVLDSYGFCGFSYVLEFADGGCLHDQIYRARLEGKDLMTPLDKLRIGIQLVTAVADLHGFEDDGIASITHNDLCCHQFVLVNGVYKLNDFHVAHLLKRNKETNETCWHEMRNSWEWRKIMSPEEGYKNAIVDNEKADDYTIGNVLYYVLTKRWIFEGVKNAKGISNLKQGKRSPFPEHIKNSTDPADQALMKGIKMLWTHNVNERPSARVVSDFLIGELERISQEQVRGQVIRATVPPLPADWQYDDDPSFTENVDD